MIDVYKQGDVVVMIFNDDLSGLYEKNVMYEIADYGFKMCEEDYFSIRRKVLERDYEEYRCPISFVRHATQREKFLYELFGAEALVSEQK